MALRNCRVKRGAWDARAIIRLISPQQCGTRSHVGVFGIGVCHAIGSIESRTPSIAVDSSGSPVDRIEHGIRPPLEKMRSRNGKTLRHLDVGVYPDTRGNSQGAR